MISLGNLIIRLCDAGFGTIEAVRRRLGRRKVETISTNELVSLLASQDSLSVLRKRESGESNDERTAGRGSSMVLLDVRSAAEQAVSKIPSAITQEEYETQASSSPRKPVVVYCTVGGRSYLYARQLVAAGVDAKNYRDGILGWCRAGLPLETLDGQPTTAVHPYWRIFRVPKSDTTKPRRIEANDN